MFKRQPKPPVNPRLELPTGQTLPLTPVYSHQDLEGIHHWILTLTPGDACTLKLLGEAAAATTLNIDRLPSRTAVTVELDPGPQRQPTLDQRR